jgi:hypothetical protein
LTNRRSPRFELALSVQVRFQDRAEITRTRTLNISQNGLFIAVDPPRPIGTAVRVRISIAASGEQFTLEGVVVRRVPDEDCPLAPGGKPGIGVFLTQTSAGYVRFCEELQRAQSHAAEGNQATGRVATRARNGA